MLTLANIFERLILVNEGWLKFAGLALGFLLVLAILAAWGYRDQVKRHKKAATLRTAELEGSFLLYERVSDQEAKWRTKYFNTAAELQESRVHVHGLMAGNAHLLQQLDSAKAEIELLNTCEAYELQHLREDKAHRDNLLYLIEGLVRSDASRHDHELHRKMVEVAVNHYRPEIENEGTAMDAMDVAVAYASGVGPRVFQVDTAGTATILHGILKASNARNGVDPGSIESRKQAYPIGTKVGICDVVEEADGWTDDWVEDMTDMFDDDAVGEVVGYRDGGIEIAFSDSDDDTFCFPVQALTAV